MSKYANINPGPFLDGTVYCTAAVLPPSEAALSIADPIPILYGEAVLAIVELTLAGSPASNSTYIILQTDLGDGVWIDVAGIVWTGLGSTATFVVSAGVAGALAIQQTRAAGTAPGANFANQIALGGRMRFVGQSTLTGGGSSSSSNSPAAQVTATIRFKLLSLR